MATDSTQTRLLIKNGKTVNDDEIVDQDVYIENGIIKQLGRNLNVPAETRVIDAQGKYVIPGGIDPHTHLEFEFMHTTTVDDFYHGTKGAVAGGTTMIIDFISPNLGQSLMDAYLSHRKKAESKACCDFSFHSIVRQWHDKIPEEMSEVCSRHGINSFKMFMTYPTFMLDDSDLYQIFENCKKLGALALIHAENGSIIKKNSERLLAKGITGPEGHELSRNEEVEAEAVNRACTISHQVNCPLYIVHMMSKSAVSALKIARERGCQAIGETLAAALGRDGNQLRHPCFQHAAGHLVSPPLRSDPTTPEALMRSLAANDLQLTGSDNCTFTKTQKELGLNDFTKIPNGVNGVEDRMSVVWEKGVHAGIIDPRRFVAITSSNAAKIFNLYPKKGCIRVGSDADIVVWNSNKTRTISAKTHHQAVDFNIFEGMECHGVPEYVLVRGRVCVDNREVKVIKGLGQYVPTPVNSPYIYDKDNFAKLVKSNK